MTGQNRPGRRRARWAIDPARRAGKVAAALTMKSDRSFHSVAAALNLLVMLIGFSAFYTSGRGENGRIIAPAIMSVVIVHGMAITAWYLLALGQALLIAVRNRKLHMTLGWAAVGLLPVIAVSGVLVAIRSAQGAPNFPFFGMRYHDFVLVMFMEIAVFTVLVTTGVLTRKRPEIHRAMMLVASWGLLIGATTRIPWLLAPFGGDGSRLAFFGPVYVLGAILVLVRSVMTRAFDRWLAAAYAFMVIADLTAEQLSRTEAWRALAATLLKH